LFWQFANGLLVKFEILLGLHLYENLGGGLSTFSAPTDKLPPQDRIPLGIQFE
jgi:hypothetical protein